MLYERRRHSSRRHAAGRDPRWFAISVRAQRPQGAAPRSSAAALPLGAPAWPMHCAAARPLSAAAARPLGTAAAWHICTSVAWPLGANAARRLTATRRHWLVSGVLLLHSPGGAPHYPLAMPLIAPGNATAPGAPCTAPFVNLPLTHHRRNMTAVIFGIQWRGRLHFSFN